MFNRSKNYFKDCDLVYQYVNMFNYIGDEDKYNINNIEDI